MRPLILPLLAILFCTLKSANASPYIEAGTGMGTFSDGDALVNQNLGSTGMGFVGSFNLYFPVTSLRNIVHLDLGLQNRFTFASGDQSSATVVTPNLSLRLEFWRFFVGGGYAPKVLVDFQPVQGASSYFGEAGIIWRVIPEFQICAAFSLEYGRTSSGATSPSPSSEYGLRFRFPLSPKESEGGGGASFDGYRYPFGIMR